MAKFEIKGGRIHTAQKIVIYGLEGVGKSTLAASFPASVFIDTEGSTNHMDVQRLPAPKTWTTLLDEVAFIRDNPGFDTLIIDTADWAEMLCIEHICKKHNMAGLESFGYGKGYKFLAEEFAKFLKVCDEVIARGINVVMTAHSAIRKFEAPDEMGAYDRWELKLTRQVAPLVKEWADLLLFASYKTNVVKVDGKFKGTAGQERVLYTEHTAAWDAKNRHGLPPVLPMEYKSIEPIFYGDSYSEGQATVAEIDQQEQAARANVNAGAPNINADAQNTGKGAGVPFSTKEPALDEYGVEIVDDNLLREVEKAFDPTRRANHDKLNELMIGADVTPEELQAVVAARGYYPIGAPVDSYATEFIDAVLVGAWNQVWQQIMENRKRGTTNNEQLQLQ